MYNFAGEPHWNSFLPIYTIHLITMKLRLFVLDKLVVNEKKKTGNNQKKLRGRSLLTDSIAER